MLDKNARDVAAAVAGMERSPGQEPTDVDRSLLYTSTDGRPYPSLTTSLKVGAHPVQSDSLLLEKQQAFDRMKIQERIVHPSGSSAFGRFEVTHNVSKLTKAKMFQLGQVTPAYTRFSTVTLGREYPDSARNPRGFATKFYTEDGNYDLVGLNWPIFFVRDPWLGPDNIRSQQRNPSSFLLDFEAWFDFFANVPESNHTGLMLLSDHGTPVGWRYMSGFGCHTFSWVNASGERTFIKYHWLSQQGTRNHTLEEATKMCGENPNYAKRDLWMHLAGGGKCAWQLCVQTMTPDEADKVEFDPFDVTKVWPRDQFKMQPVGKLTLDRNPENYFRDVEQAAFSPGSMVPGIEASPDSLLLWRMFFYRDAQYHRLGVNLHQVPDGAMRVDDNNGGKPQFMPNSLQGKDKGAPLVQPSTTEVPQAMYSTSQMVSAPPTLARSAANFRHRGKASEYDQARYLWREKMSQEERQNTGKNTAFLLDTFQNAEVKTRFLAQRFAISPDYAQLIVASMKESKGVQLAEIEAQSKTAHLVNVDPGHSLGMAKDTSFMGMKQCPYQFKS
ncbi:catalase [Acaromyces ingoldii]|uniref:Catalase n=1 Tax=Acaromyces ingoldii TaxID=215250 RepID=A0A316YCN4_9BASI|nr:catalase [Acaromyces ingoldii]PWN86634.1 catalase [Acaromyces ingoldii]